MKYGYVVIAIPKDLVPFMKENLTVATRKAILAIKESITFSKKLGLKKFPIINSMIIGIISYVYSNSLRNSAADFGESRLNGISNTVFAPLSPA